MSLLGDNKLVQALESVNGLAPTIDELVKVLVSMDATLTETNRELQAMKVELEAVKAAMGEAANQVDGASHRMKDLADRIVPEA